MEVGRLGPGPARLFLPATPLQAQTRFFLLEDEVRGQNKVLPALACTELSNLYKTLSYKQTSGRSGHPQGLHGAREEPRRVGGFCF